MQRKKVDSGLERQFAIALIVSKPFLASVASSLDVTLFQAKYVQWVAGKALEHFKQYGDAPDKSMEALYHAWVEKEQPEEEESDAVGDFLGRLSDESETAKDVNVPYLLDELSKYLTLRKAARLNDQLTAGLLQGDPAGLLESITSFSSVNLGAGVGFNPLTDKSAWERAFADPQETLIEFPGKAGRFFNGVLTRDALVGIQAPEKTGKTFLCVELMKRALMSRRKVAVFEVGDLTEAQIMRRFGVLVAGKPMRADQCKEVRVPTDLKLVEGEEGPEPEVTYETRSFESPLSKMDGWRGAKRWLRRHKIPKKPDYLKFVVVPNNTINVRGIDGILSRWAHEEGFNPDVIVIDYADILAPEDSRLDFRHQVNETWKALRRLSQERHALVIAPTQANAASYGGKTQSTKNFSEDKRKYAHVTAMLGMNQTDEEKTKQIIRFNWLVAREIPFHSSQCLWVAQCLPLGMAFVKGTY